MRRLFPAVPYSLSPVPSPLLPRIISGGQTGVDRAALDVALELGMLCGGWCPAGRWAEDGPIPLRYPLRETPSPRPEQRTEWNVRDSDATLIIRGGGRSGGTALTARLAARYGKPLLIASLAEPVAPRRVREWMVVHRVRTLNVAGPRESEEPGIGRWAWRYLGAALAPPARGLTRTDRMLRVCPHSLRRLFSDSEIT